MKKGFPKDAQIKAPGGSDSSLEPFLFTFHAFFYENRAPIS